MLFLQPLLLWGSLAAVIPIAIHLIHRRRHRTLPWAAMQFLLKASRESRGRKKLRHFLILACRALALAALALAAARPLLSGMHGWGGGSVHTVVLILDRSPSMEARPAGAHTSRREQALAQIQRTLADLGHPRLILIDSASATPQEVPSADTLPELSATAPTDSAADIPALLERATEWLADVDVSAEIWLASDLQATNWLPDDERWHSLRARLAALPQPPALRLLALASGATSNTALRLHDARRAGDEMLLDLELLRADDSAASLPLTTHLSGAATTEIIALKSASLRFQKRLPLPTGQETGFGWLSLPADGNPRDNTAFFAYGPARPVRSLVVADLGETAKYLALASAPPGFAGQISSVVAPADFSAIPADTAAILWAAPLPTGAPAESLGRFLSDGGHAVFLPPAQPGSIALLGTRWETAPDAPAGKFFTAGEWNRLDGPLRNGVDGTPVPADRLRAIRRAIPTGEPASLATWDDGQVLLARQIVDRGTAWFLGTLPDYTWSNLGDAEVLLPAIQRIVTAGASRFDTPYAARVGDETARPLPSETAARLDAAASTDTSTLSYAAGVYRLGNRLLAVNRPLVEDEPASLDPERLDALFAGIRHSRFDQAGAGTENSLSREAGTLFLLAMVAFLIAEAWLCLPPKAAAPPLPAFVGSRR